MSIPLVRRTLPNGEKGPYEPLFPSDAVEKLDETQLIMLGAMAGMQEQIEVLTAKVAKYEGGEE
ncbi:hypothetical protein ABZ756_13850 [Mammaliicoccus sciuri]|uniref:Uncharacterized protein n=1 Tax=Sporosarcina newyorkensis TaxID=759851 RepID=A0A1T4YT79_9BACL|nr:hypothetical protein [Sporosarcina newyorkensis]SKB05077.1 hypothetical protein SAMN04244570_3545 [Sporosarcina newyorkensis]